MRTVPSVVVSLFGLTAVAVGLQAQQTPAAPPNHLTIFVENLKPGMEADHTRNEAGWPRAAEEAGSPYTYLALESLTGQSHVWYVSAYESFAQEGESMKLFETNTHLGQETSRLWRADAQYLASTFAFQAVGRPDLSYGGGVDINRHRFWEITSMRVRLGHEAEFEAAAQVFIGATRRLNPDANFRAYQVISGMNGSNYLFFSSVETYGEFDQVMAGGNAVMAGLTAQEGTTLQEVFTQHVQNVVTHRYRLSPDMSYVDADTRAASPEFWNANR